MRATILFPGDYFSLSNPNDNFVAELEAVSACDGLEVLLFNYDEYIGGAPLRLSKSACECARLLIYRGWMMQPRQYERFHGDLVGLGFEPLTSPACYERMHCFPNAGSLFEGQTPRYKVYPATGGRVRIDAAEVNASFGRFVVKDYVKSAKGTGFPQFVDTPVTQGELDALVERFVELRGELFTGGIVLKEHVELKQYGKATNEWREFRFLDGVRLALARNSNQPEDCPRPPDDYLITRNRVACPFYTVDYAELEDGSWTIVEVGDGGVSGLAAADSAVRFYEQMTNFLGRICSVPEGMHAVNYGVFDGKISPDDVCRWLAAHPEELALAYCYAFAHNRVGMLGHDLDDPDGTTSEGAFDEWWRLEQKLFTKIEQIRLREGAPPRDGGMHYYAAPFMARNGYADGCGWWVAE